MFLFFFEGDIFLQFLFLLFCRLQFSSFPTCMRKAVCANSLPVLSAILSQAPPYKGQARALSQRLSSLGLLARTVRGGEPLPEVLQAPTVAPTVFPSVPSGHCRLPRHCHPLGRFDPHQPITPLLVGIHVVFLRRK